jgi:hypothetical protein
MKHFLNNKNKHAFADLRVHFQAACSGEVKLKVFKEPGSFFLASDSEFNKTNNN